MVMPRIHLIHLEMERLSGRGCWGRPSRTGHLGTIPGPAASGARFGQGDQRSCAQREDAETPAAPATPHPTPTADPAPSAKPQPRSPEGVRVSGLLPTAQPGRRSGICGPRAPPRGHQASCTRAARLLSEAVCAFLFGSSKLEYRTNSGFPDPVCDASGGYRSKRDVSRNLAKT